MKSLIVLMLVAISSISNTACNSTAESNSDTKDTPGKGLRKLNPDSGDFILQYAPPDGEFYARYISYIKSNGLVQNMINELNKTFVLPFNITVTITNKKDANAYYLSDSKSIELDLDMVDMIFDILEAHVTSSDEALQKSAMNAVVFILFHEVGHALMDIYHLAKLGEEEDLVDNFAVFLLSSGNEAAEQAALDGASFFYGLYREFGISGDMRTYMDEHSLDIKRFYNIINLLFGKDPGKYKFLVEQGILSAETYNKTPKLVKNYNDIMEGWRRSLGTKLKNNNTTAPY